MFNVDNVALNVCASLLDTAADLLLALETFIRLAGEESRHHFGTVPLFGLVLNCVALTFKSNRFLGEVMTKYFHSAIQLAACVATTFQPSSVEDISLSKRMASVLTLATLNAKDVSVVSSVLQMVFPFSLEYLFGAGLRGEAIRPRFGLHKEHCGGRKRRRKRRR
ncbi:hypothetical protein ADEAN_000063700 [Angomonas deanei]|uniref:Uncharacterized protein n=1 Tax=Angomonas deanei TaxID=59799 RepID=A0A7G2C0E0_9TRYP|nr:hypothetical protein ADEAN_000063700 [Angomonas deanei]